MVVSSPREVDAPIRRIPQGRLAPLDEVRAHLARRHGAEGACPVSTAIFVNVAAQAAEEFAAIVALLRGPAVRGTSAGKAPASSLSRG